MKEYKNIDELLKDVTNDFGVEPSAGVWDAIHKEVIPQQKAKFAYSKWIIAAALLLLFFGAGYWFVQRGSQLTNKEYEIVGNTSEENSDELLTEDKIEEESILNQIEENNNYAIENSEELRNEKVANIESKLPIVTSYESSHNPKANSESLAVINELDDEIPTKDIDQIINSQPEIQFITPLSLYSLTSMDLSAIVAPMDLTEYLDKRKKLHTYTGIDIKVAMVYYPNTQDQFTFNADLRFGLIVKNFYFETGLGYQEMKERGNYKITYNSNDSVGYYNKVESFIVDPQNSDNLIYNTKATTVYDSIEHYNLQTPLFKYSYLNIPLRIGYKIWNRDQISLGIETGAIFSKLLKSEIPKPEFYDSESTLVKIEDLSPTRVDINYQFLLGLRLNYKFNSSVSISAHTEFTKYLNSIYSNENGLEAVRPYTMGFGLGIYYDF